MNYTKEFETACMTNNRVRQCEILNNHGSKICFNDIPIIQLIDACEAGHLQEVKGILNTYPDLNICGFDDGPIREACYNGHLELAKWLLLHDSRTNVFNKNGNVFKIVCLNGHLNVAKWLVLAKILNLDTKMQYTTNILNLQIG